jgi:hypothetical protein
VSDHHTERPTAYRKKPVEIEAMRLGSENAGAVVQWINGHYVDGDVASMRGGPGGGSKGGSVLIRTLEGVMTAAPGDWVIRGVQHEFYPCKAEIFAATYEAVGQPTTEERR